MKKEALGFWNGPWGRAVRSAKKCYPELPFIYKTKHGLLKGQIDLVFQTAAGEWVLLDYKTHALTPARSPEAAAENYHFQLRLYALVFSRLYGEEPKKGVLYFSSAGRAVEMPYAKDEFSGMERELDTAFKKLDF